MITGEYQFQLSNDQSNILLIYQSLQGARSHQKTSLNTQLKKGEENLYSGSNMSSTLPTVSSSSQLRTTNARQEESSFPVTMGSVKQRWTREQIGNFVRKLGFLDTKKEGGDKIKQFLHVNSVSICFY